MKGVTNEQFRISHCHGLATFISFERLMKETIQENLKSDEKLKGMTIDENGITLYLETK